LNNIGFCTTCINKVDDHLDLGTCQIMVGKLGLVGTSLMLINQTSKAVGTRLPTFLALFLLLSGTNVNAQSSASSKETEVPVVFTGGHETDPRDHGRPVVLVAAGLGVTPEVFREAFSRVHPAGPGRSPEEHQVRENKHVLMEALGKYGVTDDRLNEVSNYYRYPPGAEHSWTQRPAQARALIRNGKISRFVITDAGAGYSSPPSIAVPQLPNVRAKCELSFVKDLQKNGEIGNIKLDN
jgi:hypothetical protein